MTPSPISVSLRRAAALLAILLSGATATVFAASGKSKSLEAPGPVVHLSPFEVRAESVEFNRWNKFTSPHFVLYTDTGSKEAHRVIREMEMLHQAVQFFLRRKSLNVAPIIVILPTARSDWRKIENRGSVEWEVASSLVGETRKVVILQYDWQRLGLDSLWAMLGVQETHDMNLEGPLWFARGIAAFFSTVIFKGDTLTLGKQGADAFWLRKNGWMDWAKFFSVTSSSDVFRKDTNDHNRFEGQCGVFTHFLLTNPEPVWTSRLLAWATYLDSGNEPTADAFKQVFQIEWGELQARIDKMLNGGKYNTGTIRFPPAALQFTIDSPKLPVREMRELFVLTQILNQHTKESDESLDAVLARGIRTESLHELLADACESRKRYDEELRELRAIIEAGSTNPAVYAEAAQRLFAGSFNGSMLDTRIDRDVEDMRAWCRKAIELEPYHLDANEGLAFAEALGPTVSNENIESIVAICRRLEGHAATDDSLLALAIARWRSGDAKRTRSLAGTLIKSPWSDKKVKKAAAALIARLDGVVPEAAATPASGQSN